MLIAIAGHDIRRTRRTPGQPSQPASGKPLAASLQVSGHLGLGYDATRPLPALRLRYADVDVVFTSLAVLWSLVPNGLMALFSGHPWLLAGAWVGRGPASASGGRSLAGGPW